MGTVDMDSWRVYTQVATTPNLEQAWPDQWLDWGDHTVSVDPVGNKQWIHDSHDGHYRSEERARHLDRREVKRLVDWHSSDTATHHYYIPTSGEIGRKYVYSDPFGSDCRSWRGAKRDPTRFGLLPSISAQLYEGKLGNKSTHEIEAEIRESERWHAHRLFDRSGWSR